MVSSWITYKSNFWVNGTRIPLNLFVQRSFCDMEYLEDTQYFYEYALPDVFNPDAGIVFSCYEDSEYVAEGGDKSNP